MDLGGSNAQDRTHRAHESPPNWTAGNSGPPAPATCRGDDPQPPIRWCASVYEDDETIALVGHCAHIVAQPRKMMANLLAPNRLIARALPVWPVMGAEQPFHILRFER